MVCWILLPLVGVGMPILVRLPLVKCCSSQLSGSLEHLLPFIALSDSKLSLNCSELSSTSSGSVEWAKVGGCPFMNSPCLSRGGTGGASATGWFCMCCTIVCISWVYTARICSKVAGDGGGGGLGLLWAPLPDLVLLAICFPKQNAQNLSKLKDHLYKIKEQLKVFGRG